jgi:hypothetical protein
LAKCEVNYMSLEHRTIRTVTKLEKVKIQKKNMKQKNHLFLILAGIFGQSTASHRT